jgi:hypothetical protein
MAGEGEHEHASTEELFESILHDVATRAFEGHTEDEIERVVASGRLGKALQETIPEVSKQLADKLVATAPQMLAERAGALAVIAEEVRRTYGPGLDLFEAPDSERDGSGVRGALFADRRRSGRTVGTRAPASPCLPDRGGGANAAEGRIRARRSSRWRALYEIAVVATFVGKHGDETAVRYVDHHQFPENVTFLELLIAIGQPELAIAHVAEIDTATAGNDRRSAAMRLALALHNAGLVPEASRLFELYEPLEWFGARRAGHSGPLGGSSDLLTSWARAAAVLHGSSYVLKASAALRSPLGLDEHDRYSEDEIVHLRGELIWVAAIELFHRDRIEEVSPLRAELDRLGTPARDAFTLLGLYLAGISAANVAEELSMITMLDVDHLPDWGRIEMIERLLKLGDRQTARELFAQLPVPVLPERDYTRLSEEEPSWNMFYRYWRLTVRFGSPPGPVTSNESRTRTPACGLSGA